MKKIITAKDGKVAYFADFFSPKESTDFFQKFYSEIPWQQDKITLFGRQHLIPRKQALYADDARHTYQYSGHMMRPESMTKALKSIQNRVNDYFGLSLNAVLLNLYEHGQHSNGWHADDEKELGQNPTIVSVSFGAVRKFKIKHKTTPEKHDIMLENGSLLIMEGAFQHHWKHTLPKTTQKVGPRINLTFRTIKS